MDDVVAMMIKAKSSSESTKRLHSISLHVSIKIKRRWKSLGLEAVRNAPGPQLRKIAVDARLVYFMVNILETLFPGSFHKLGCVGIFFGQLTFIASSFCWKRFFLGRWCSKKILLNREKQQQQLIGAWIISFLQPFASRLDGFASMFSFSEKD